MLDALNKNLSKRVANVENSQFSLKLEDNSIQQKVTELETKFTNMGESQSPVSFSARLAFNSYYLGDYDKLLFNVTTLNNGAQ